MDVLAFKPKEPSREELQRELAELKEANKLYLDHGYDREQAVKFLVDSAEPIEEPILDIGTGRGMVAVEIARRGHSLTSIDISAEALQRAYIYARIEGVSERVDFRLIDGANLPFDDESFNLVTLVNVLHHLHSFESMIGEVSRVLVPGGRMLVADFTEEGLRIIEDVLTKRGLEHGAPVRYTLDDVAERMHKYGLQCVMRDIRFHEAVLLAQKAD